MTSGNFVHGNHSLGINAFHLEWCPKYRYSFLSGAYVKKILTESLMETAEKYKFQILALEIAADHLHIFVSLPPQLSVSFAVQLMKGRSSRAIFKACPSFRNFYHMGHFWSKGKFFRSVSNVGASTVFRYISEHKTKELNDTVKSARQEAQQMNLLAFC